VRGDVVLDVPTAQESARILVVDDEPQIRRVLSVILDSRGRQIIMASSGNQGSDELGTEDVDLMILDLMMTDTNGLEILSTIRADPPADPYSGHHSV